jgi:hypothetical protein
MRELSGENILPTIEFTGERLSAVLLGLDEVYISAYGGDVCAGCEYLVNAHYGYDSSPIYVSYDRDMANRARMEAVFNQMV